MKRVGHGLLVVGAVASLAACQLLLGIEDSEEPIPSSSSSGDVSSSSSSSGFLGVCDPDPEVSARPPPNPGGEDFEVPGVLTFAFRKVEIIPQGEIFGFDLDGKVTSADGGVLHNATCEPRSPAARRAGDGPGGADNNLFRAIALARSLFPEPDPPAVSANAAFVSGKATSLLQIGGWSREKSDPSVQVYFMASPGLERTGAPLCTVGAAVETCGLQPPGPTSMTCRDLPTGTGDFRDSCPKWDGTDVWRVATAESASRCFGAEFGTVGGWSQATREVDGYVSDSTLVVPLRTGSPDEPAIELNLGAGGALRFTTAVMSAEISGGQNGKPLEVKGMMSGTVNPYELFASFYTLDTGNGLPLCLDTGLSKLFCDALANYRDFDSTRCAGDPDQELPPCTELSLAIRFEAVQALTGCRQVFDTSTLEIPPECAPFDPADEQCSFVLRDAGPVDVDGGDAGDAGDAADGE